MPADLRETALYQPIKAFLQSQGYAVKGEIGACDMVAVREEEPPVVVELKATFSLTLLLQAVDRMAVSDTVYLAFADPGPRSLWRREQKRIKKLCRLLGLGVLLVRLNGSGETVEPVLDPMAYRPRRNKRRQTRLLKEFFERVGDPTPGGSTRRPVMTAYRQAALACADAIAREGALPLARLRALTGVGIAGKILQRNVYGWFDRVERGTYALSPRGTQALEEFSDVVAALRRRR